VVDNRAVLHYKCDVREPVFLPTKRIGATAAGTVIFSKDETDPVGVQFLVDTATAEMSFSDYDFEWAKQKPLNSEGIMRYAKSIYNVNPDWRGLCPTGILLRGTDNYIRFPGSAPSARVDKFGQTLESWERLQGCNSDGNISFCRGLRSEAYDEVVFPGVTMIQYWRAWLRNTTPALVARADGEDVGSRRAPVLCSATTAGLFPCRPQFDFHGNISQGMQTQGNITQDRPRDT
jgi:hypothetical protein